AAKSPNRTSRAPASRWRNRCRKTSSRSSRAPSARVCPIRMAEAADGGYPVTPDGRYFVVRGRLWRMSDPSLDPGERDRLVKALMAARRAVSTARRADDADAKTDAHAAVDRAKHALGERGPVWW